MKGDYSQPGLMPGHCSEQIDLPSAYLFYAFGSRPTAGTTFAGRRTPFRTAFISTRILRDLAEIMAVMSLKGPINHFLEVSD